MALHFNTVQRHFRILLVWFRYDQCYDQYFVLFHFDCPCRTGVYADPAPDTFARVRDMRIHIRSSFFHYYAECRANFYTGLTPRTILIVKFHDWIIHFVSSHLSLFGSSQYILIHAKKFTSNFIIPHEFSSWTWYLTSLFVSTHMLEICLLFYFTLSHRYAWSTLPCSAYFINFSRFVARTQQVILNVRYLCPALFHICLFFMFCPNCMIA